MKIKPFPHCTFPVLWRFFLLSQFSRNFAKKGVKSFAFRENLKTQKYSHSTREKCGRKKLREKYAKLEPNLAKNWKVQTLIGFTITRSKMLLLEWLYFCVFKFSRNAKDFTPFFAKFRENCESKKKRHSTGNVLYVHENGFNFDLIQSVKKQRLSMYGFVTNIWPLLFTKSLKLENALSDSI